jgi:hypothetical protein
VELGALILATAIADFFVTALDHGAHRVALLAGIGGVLVIGGVAVRHWRTVRRQVTSARARPLPQSVADQRENGGVRWRIRTTVADTPGRLAALCAGLAALDVNILAVHMQTVRPLPDAVIDEFLVIAPGDVNEGQIAAAMTTNGGIGTEVWSVDANAFDDAETPSWIREREPAGTS